jgi:enoyl-CoA hydratase/carnithine racemase
MTQLVTLSIADGIADIRLNRPDKHNALTFELFAALNAAAESVAVNAAVRIVVLSGNGPSFCGGLDLSIMRQFLQGPTQARAALDSVFTPADRADNPAQRAAYAWKLMPMPVIAALRGVAFGGGCQIALGADIRIAAPDTKLSLMEIKYGLIADMSVTQTLRDLVSFDVAMELALTGRIIEADEALKLHLITRIAPDPHATAMDLARQIASRSPHAVRATKRLLRESWHADADTGLKLEQALQSTLLGSPNQVESVNASLEKRAPAFRDIGS